MDQFDQKRLKSRMDIAAAERAMFEPLLDDCIRLAKPAAKRFRQDTPGEDLAEEIFDDTGAVALQEYASRVQAGVTPNFVRWASLECDGSVPERDRIAINTDLEAINDFIFEEIWKSNFSPEIFELYLDMGISTGNMLVEPGHRSLFHHTSIPMTEVYLEHDAWGELTGCFRERAKVKLGNLYAAYPTGEFSNELARQIEEQPDKEVKITDAFWRDTSVPIGEEANFIATMIESPGAGCEIIRKQRHVGWGSSPYIGTRFMKASGETWGRGPLMTALPSIRTLNQTLEYMLQNAAMSMVGMYHIDEDAQINPDTVTIEPGALIPRAAGTRGLERIETGGGEFRVAEILQVTEATKIKRAMFNDMMSDPNRTPATALEISERMADLANRMSAAFGRLHYELIQPYMRRVLWIAEQQGLIELPRIKGKQVKINAISPLAMAQGQRDVQTFMQYHQISTSMVGPQMAMAQYNLGKVLPDLRDKMGVNLTWFQTIEDMIKAGSAMAAAQAGGVPTGGAPAGPMQGGMG